MFCIVICFTPIINFSCCVRLLIITFCFKKNICIVFKLLAGFVFNPFNLILPFKFMRLIVVFLVLLLEITRTAVKQINQHHDENTRLSWPLLCLSMKFKTLCRLINARSSHKKDTKFVLSFKKAMICYTYSSCNVIVFKM